MSESKYTEGPPDYGHRYHAGNIGDVLKHIVLGAWLRAMQTDIALTIVDTHAGDGMYQLPPRGEWDAGIGRLDARDTSDAPPVVRAYLDAVGDRRISGRGGLYPGSPAQLRAGLRPEDRLVLADTAEPAHAKLAAFYTEDAQVEVRSTDGLETAATVAASPGLTAVFIDPPYSQKAEWPAVAEGVRAIRAADPESHLLLWYPIKSPTRPQRLVASLRDLGPGATIELISTPLKAQKKALNGSGLLLLRPPRGVMDPLAAALPWLGKVLAHPGFDEWSANLRQWR